MVLSLGDVKVATESGALCIESQSEFVALDATDNAGRIRRSPPIEVVRPFGGLIEAETIKSDNIVEPNEIVDVNVRDGLLIGERAFISEICSMVFTDSTHSRHLPWIYESDDRRQFEAVPLVKTSDGFELSNNCTEVSFDRPITALTGMEYDNYGAFLLRLLPKIISVKRMRVRSEDLIVPSKEWQKKIFSVFGLDISNSIAHDRTKNYRACNLIVPGMRTSELYMDDPTRDMFKEVAVSLSLKDIKTNRPERIYVSRINQSRKYPQHRQLLNEQHLANILVSRGFSIFEPQEHSFEEQVRTFNAAKIIVGPGGAGMFNTIFCKPKCLIISLESMLNWLVLHANVFASSGVSYALVVGGADPSDMTVQKRWVANIDAVLLLMKRLGI